MSSNILARIIMNRDGEAHIIYDNCRTTICSANALWQLLSDPFDFCKKQSRSLISSTHYINPCGLEMSEVPGLTLATMSAERTFKCIFPELFQMFFNSLNDGMDKQILSVKSLLNNSSKDEKRFLIDMYLSVAGKNPPVIIDRSLNLTDEAQTAIFYEIFNSAITPQYINPDAAKNNNETLDNTPEPDIKENVTVENTEDEKNNIRDIKAEKEKADIPSHYISSADYAMIKGVPVGTVRGWIKENKLKTAKQGFNRRWWIDPKDFPTGRKKKENTKPRYKGDKNIRLKGKSYHDVQVWLKKLGWFSDAVRPYIRTEEEARYYHNHNFHEVCWDGKSALIIDVQPYYICKTKGLSNRNLMMLGKSPVIPNDEEHTFHLHHIGQKKDSPFAIIPETDHNSPALYSIFHPEKHDDEDLHSTDFQKQKADFWKIYQKIYDQYEQYKKIPFITSKNRKAK